MHKNEKQGAWAALYRVATERFLVKACACLFVPRCPCLFYCRSTWVYWLEVKAFWNNYTSGSLKMNRTFVLLFAGFIAAIKVFINLQTAASPSKVSFSWTCLCWGSAFGLNARVTCCQWSWRSSAQSLSCGATDLHGQIKRRKRDYEIWKPLSCLIEFPFNHFNILAVSAC